MWIFDVRKGEFWRDTAPDHKFTAYSGHGDGLNNPDMEQVHGVGALPRGDYTIGPWHDDPHLGPMVARLIPKEWTQMFGRGGMYLHGDNRKRNHTASDGCVVEDYWPRKAIKDSGDKDFRVV